MDNQIIFLTDYKDNFGSKFNSIPYRSGLDKVKLATAFYERKIVIKFMNYNEVGAYEDQSGKIYIHDSIEDTNYHYKDYIEDIVYFLELKNATVIPGFRNIRSHNNKVFMELQRGIFNISEMNNLPAEHFGALEDFLRKSQIEKYPIVIKGAQDAQGRQVKLGKSKESLLDSIKSVSRSRIMKSELKDFIRPFIHKDYQKESKYRRKFILQDFIPDLENDWKILIFNNKYYILRRGIKKNDFRASGSKTNYGFGSKSSPPDGIFDFAEKVFKTLDVPYLSIDVAFDGKVFYLLEFQAVCFGSSTQLKSDCYFIKSQQQWIPVFEVCELESLYADSIINFLQKKGSISEGTICS